MLLKSKKEEIIILTKVDMIEDQKLVAKKVKEFDKLGKSVFVLSLFDDKMIKDFTDRLTKVLKANL